MAKQCEICGKSPVVGRQISHAHNVSARRFEPNLQRVRAVNGGGEECADVLEDPRSLGADINAGAVDQLARGRVEGHLPGDEEELAGFERG